MPDVMIAQYGEKILYVGQERRHAEKALMDELKKNSEDRVDIIGYSNLGQKSDASFNDDNFPEIFRRNGYILGTDRPGTGRITSFSIQSFFVKDWKSADWTEYTELPIPEEADGE